VTSKTNIHDYGIEQMNRLLTTLAYQAHRAAKKPGPDEIHDLRVSVRRFSQGLELFGDFFPESEVKKISKMLKRVMSVTSDIRDRDITLDFLKEAGHAAHQSRLQKERSTYQRQFSEMLRRWTARDFSTKWRSGLSLRGV
jgi:CHAD domain-containing protein